MFRFPKTQLTAGFTYIELIFTISITVLIFGAIILSFQYALELGYVSRVKLSAQSLANDRMEYFRSLPYDDVGVVSGFPAGTIPQTSTFSLNGFSIEERVRVDYIDDPADGQGGVDANLVTTDYKKIRVEYSWTVNEKPGQYSLTSNIVPRAVETSVGGGTIRINVLDADYSPLENATVRVLSSSSTFSYDVTNQTDASGAALFSVPADSDYQTFVTANISGAQYSTSSTYVATTSNPIPVVAPFAVNEADVSTVTFQIGELSDLIIRTKTDITEGSVIELFDDSAGLATTTNATTTGSLELSESGGVYEAAGIAYLNSVEPVSILNWEAVRVAAAVPANTNFSVQFFTGTTTNYTLIPDSDLPGNSTGFTDAYIDVSDLDSSLYPTTTIGISLSTSDTSFTPSVGEIEIFWRESEVPLVSETLEVQSDKIIGTESDLTPIYKWVLDETTDVNGAVTIEGLEFDTYTITPSGSYALTYACPSHPFLHQAGIDGEVELIYKTPVTTDLRVSVLDGLDRPVPGASVRLEAGSGTYDETARANSCGQVYFSGGGLVDETDYRVTVSAAEYSTEIIDPFDISGNTELTTTLNP